MHRILDHENILSYLATFVSGRSLWLVMPLQGYGSCKDVMAAQFRTGFPELIVAMIIKEVLIALVYLHQKRYIHR